MRVAFDLPDELRADLDGAAATCGITPTMWAAEAVHSALALRRLPHVREGRCGPRLSPATGRAVTDGDDFPESRAVLAPSDVPTEDELSSLESIR